MLKSLAAALAAAVASAIPQQGSPDEIVVQGTRERDRQIDEFVEAMTKVPFGGQLSRFDWAVCPAAIGLGGARNAAAVERMRNVARAAGMKVAGAGCRPNALLIVTGDKAELIERMRASYPAYFEGVPDGLVRELMRHTGPAVAWHVEGRLDADGLQTARDSVTGVHIVERTDVASHLSLPSRPHFIASVVVVDIDRLSGLTMTQLADYAAMRAFARTDPSRLHASAAPTILTALEAPMGSAVPVTMTEWDLAYLKALYGSSSNRLAKRQRGEMKRLVRQELQRSRPDRD